MYNVAELFFPFFKPLCAIPKRWFSLLDLLELRLESTSMNSEITEVDHA